MYNIRPKLQLPKIERFVVLDGSLNNSVSLASVKSWLQIDSADHDALLQTLIEEADEIATDLTGTVFGSANYVVKFYGQIATKRELQLFGGNVLSITEVKLDGEIAAASDYKLKGGGLFWYILPVQSCKEIEVDYVAGYEVGSEPKGMQNIIKKIVAHNFENRGDIGESSGSLPKNLHLDLRKYTSKQILA